MRPNLTWLITDTHLYHERLTEDGHRPPGFSERIIANCRRLLRPGDTLLHLGDVIFYRQTELKSLLDSIPGTKILVVGNHDRKTKGWYLRNGFAFAADAIVLGDVVFSHKPLERLPSGARLNVHGHWHDSDHRKKESESFWSPETHKLLAIEHTEYCPVPMDAFVAPQTTIAAPEDGEAASVHQWWLKRS